MATRPAPSSLTPEPLLSPPRGVQIAAARPVESGEVGPGCTGGRLDDDAPEEAALHELVGEGGVERFAVGRYRIEMKVGDD